MDPADRNNKHTWTTHEYEAFVDICWKLTRDGFRTKACLDDKGYQRLNEEFLQRTGVALRKSQFRNKWDNTKQTWKAYKKLRSLSGTGRDPVTSIVTASNAWWESAPAKYKKFKNVGLPYEDKLDFIFSGLSPACTRQFAGGTGAPTKYIEDDSEGEPELAAMIGSQMCDGRPASTGDMSSGSSSHRGVSKRRLAEFQAFCDILWQTKPKNKSGKDTSTARSRPRQDGPLEAAVATTPQQYDAALEEVLAASIEGDSDEYIAAADLLQNPHLLVAYMKLPTIEKKIGFLRKMWIAKNK